MADDEGSTARYVRGPGGYCYHRATETARYGFQAACGALTRTDVTTISVFDRRFGVACSRCFPTRDKEHDR